MRRHLVTVLAIALSSAACTGGKDKDNASTQEPVVESVMPTSATVSQTIVVTGTDFGDLEAGTSFLRIGGVDATIDTWTDDSITAVVPAGAYPGSREITVVNADGTSNSLAFTVVLPRALYFNDDIDADNSIEGFSVSAAGAASAVNGSPWLQGVDGPGYGGYGETLAIDATRRRVLTTANSLLYAWDIDPVTGALTTSGSLALVAATLAYGTVVDATGTHAYVADYDGEIHGATISSSGTLSAIAGSPFDAGANMGTTRLAFSRDGSFLYSNNEQSFEMHGYVVAANGVLAELTNSPFTGLGSSLSFDRAPDADRYYVSLATYITAYEPNGAGDLAENTALRETMPGQAYLAFSADGSRLFATRLTQLFVFDVAASGELVAVAGSPFTLAGIANATTVRVSTDGLLLVKDTNASDFHLYTVSGAGTPTEVAGSPFAMRTDAFGSGAGFTF